MKEGRGYVYLALLVREVGPVELNFEKGIFLPIEQVLLSCEWQRVSPIFVFGKHDKSDSLLQTDRHDVLENIHIILALEVDICLLNRIRAIQANLPLNRLYYELLVSECDWKYWKDNNKDREMFFIEHSKI